MVQVGSGLAISFYILRTFENYSPTHWREDQVEFIKKRYDAMKAQTSERNATQSMSGGLHLPFRSLQSH